MRAALIASIALLLCTLGSGRSDSRVRDFRAKSGAVYELTVSAPPDHLASGDIYVTVRDPRGVLVEKPLHAFDPDLFTILRARATAPITVELAAHGPSLDRVSLEWNAVSAPAHAAIAAGPLRDWRDAQDFSLGQPVFGSGDERPYAPVSQDRAYESLASGTQWLRFTSRESASKLVYFSLDVTSRDVPADLDIFHMEDSALVPYREGASSYVPEATQNFPGLFKFRTRIVHPGATYYVRVSANHPAWQLRTELYDVPPYRDPQQAVRAGMNYLVRLGEAWHANMPRRGAVALRNTMPHAESQSCIACHPTQFTARAYLTAVKNGYPATNRPAIDFLIDRLRNNPRPLYGTNADWSRVIFSARTVSSRVPVLLDMNARLLGGSAAPDVTRAYANYLSLHWKDRTELPGDEADGSAPNVSPFEIALQSWRTFGLAGLSADQERVERLLASTPPANVIDLSWKITAVSTINRAKYASDIDALITTLYSHQRPDGRFAYAFDPAAPASDFMSYQAMYALAVAGRRPESDPHLRHIVDYALHAQRPEGAWQGDPVYKGFDTPFRDTQFAVMGLSELYPYTASTPEVPTDIQLLANTSPVLAREAAARESRNPEDLSRYLSDPSKLVRRAAAESLRKLGSSGAPTLLAALSSPDSRTRSGAIQAFDSHFHDLTYNEALLTAVTRLLPDPSPNIRFQSAKALWQWYSWARLHEQRAVILDALTARTAIEPDAQVRRALSESIYNVLDENLGQLASWQRAIAKNEDRLAIEGALHSLVREQSQILAKHIASANREGRIALLTALWDFHMRHMAIPDDSRGKVDVILPAFFSEYAQGVPHLGEKDFEYAPYRETASFRYGANNGFQVVRLGNDSDLIHLFADSGPDLENALLACLKDADRDLTLQVIKAGSVLGEAATPRFTTAMLALLESNDPAVRSAVRYVYENNARGSLTLGANDELAPQLAALLVPTKPEALAVALPLLAALEPTHPLMHNWPVMGKVEALARDSSLPSFPAVLRAAAAFPRLADEPLMRAQILEALRSGDERTGAAAVELVVSRYATDFNVGALARQFMEATQGRLRAMLLDQLDPSKYSQRVTAANSYNGGGNRGALPADNNLFSSREVVEFVSESLADSSLPVREAARDLVTGHKELRDKLAPPAEPRASLDYAYFTSKVEPILNRSGADGKACVMCHASHALFKLRPGQSRANFASALKVIDQTEPRKSLLLIKPTRPNDSAGDPNLYLATHNGGERWQGNESSPEYQTILEWIRGARTRACSAGTLSGACP